MLDSPAYADWQAVLQVTPELHEKAAVLGEPSYLWRDGQERRLKMILDAADGREHGRVLDNGCGIGLYLQRLSGGAGMAVGLEIDRERAAQAKQRDLKIVSGAGERTPFADNLFDLILSHEVIEHVRDDRAAVREAIRLLRTPGETEGSRGGRMVLFAPNRGYPFETHGIYWRGRYRFGNIPLVNYLPRMLRNRLAPHVRAYSKRDIERLFDGLPVRIVCHTILFGAYDNLISRWGILGRIVRFVLQGAERTPLRAFGLSHLWIVERC